MLVIVSIKNKGAGRKYSRGARHQNRRYVFVGISLFLNTFREKPLKLKRVINYMQNETKYSKFSTTRIPGKGINLFNK